MCGWKFQLKTPFNLKTKTDSPENPMADINGRFLPRLNPCPGTVTFSTSCSNPIMIYTKKVEQIPPMKFDQTIHFFLFITKRSQIKLCVRKLGRFQCFLNTISEYHHFTYKMPELYSQKIANYKKIKENSFEKHSAVCLEILKCFWIF